MSRKPNPEQVEMMRGQGCLTPQEASDKAHINVYTLYRWLRKKKVRRVEVGHSIYVDMGSLASFLGPEASRAAGLPAPVETPAEVGDTAAP